MEREVCLIVDTVDLLNIIQYCSIEKSDEFPILNTSIFSDDYTISAEILKRLGALFKHFVFLKFNF